MKTNEQIIQIIKERTEANDHNEALILASTLLDNLQGSDETIRTKILKHVREIAYLKGFMSIGLLEVREESRPWIMNGLKELLTAEEFQALEEAV